MSGYHRCSEFKVGSRKSRGLKVVNGMRTGRADVIELLAEVIQDKCPDRVDMVAQQFVKNRSTARTLVHAGETLLATAER